MDILIRILMAFEALICLMLIGIILIQRSKGHGMGLSFGGGQAEAVFGGQMGNVLTRSTVILAIIFLVNTTLLAMLKPRGVSADVTDRMTVEAPVAPATPEIPAATTSALDEALLQDIPAAPAAEAPATPAVEVKEEAPKAEEVKAEAAPAAPVAPAAEAPKAEAAPAVPVAPAAEAPKAEAPKAEAPAAPAA